MTIQDLKTNKLILFECISGSRAYGLDVPGSDTDIRGVFLLPKENFYGLNYIQQVADDSNDTVYYELGRFIELLSKNNPNILELLNTPEDKVLYRHPIMDKIQSHYFLSKKCRSTFGGYAFSQIKKAQGLNKKIVNPIAKARKSILEFCYVLYDQGSLPLSKWLEMKSLEQSKIGLVNVPHARGVFAMFYDTMNTLGYKGIMWKTTASEVLLSSIPKGEEPIGHLHFNKDGYTKYCKDYRDYWTWVEERNENRYLNNVEHGKNYDSKNMMHTFRLLDMAEEILLHGEVIVKRPNREELLAIRKGEYTYEALIKKAETKMQAVEAAYKQSVLPEIPDLGEIEKLLVELRGILYS